jgi:5-methylthioadenosine/S-adenosylhomocysteine deaminase
MTTLLRGATILTCDAGVPDLLRGDLLVRDGTIVEVSAEIPAPPDAQVVDLAGSIVHPGLVDAHQHLWEGPYLLQEPDLSLGGYFTDFVPGAAGAVTPDGLHDSVASALRTALRSGTTMTFDWCHVTNTAQHAEASLAAGVASGARYIFGYGPPVALGYYGSPLEHPLEMEQVAAAQASHATDLIGVAAALRGPDLSPPDVMASDIRRARAAGLSVSMHVSVRRAGPGGVTALHEAGLLGPDLQFVHLTDATDIELAMVADSGGRIVVPPIAELSMGTGTPPLKRIAAGGGRAALAVDTVLCSPPDMFNQMRSAAGLLRDGVWDGAEPPTGSRTAEILRAATIEGARACWLDDVTGSLTPGKFADLVVMRPSRPVTSITEALAQVVWMGDPSRVESVLVAGVEQLTTEQA